MSEYMFGVTKRKLTKQEINRRDRICREEGGYGYTQINDPGQGWKGWFSGPNRGHPYDAQLAQRVLERL